MWMYPRSISFRLCVPAFLILTTSLAGCATGQYGPLGDAEMTEVKQLKENVYRVEYRASAFTSQEQLDYYLRRRCAELTLPEGYDYFHLAGRLMRQDSHAIQASHRDQSEQMIAGHDAASHDVDFGGGLCQTRICGIFRKCASVVITAKPYCIADAAIQISFVGIGVPTLHSVLRITA